MTHDPHTGRYSAVIDDLNDVRAELRALDLRASEMIGLLEHTLTKVKHMASDIERAQAKLDELQGKLADYKKREEKQIADLKTANDTKDALIAANQAAVDALNAKIAELQAQVDAGTNPNLQALIDDMQSTVDDLTEAQVPPGETPVG